MKRILLIALLIAASSSFALVWSINRSAQSVEEAIIAQEKQVSEAIRKKDSAAFKNLVAADAIAVGMHGPTNISEAMSILFSPEYKSEDVKMESPQVKMVDKDAALITYKSTGTESYKGESHTFTSYQSTLWVKQGNKWMAVFHQTTPIIQEGEGGGQ